MKVKILQSFHIYGEAKPDGEGVMRSGPKEDFAAGWTKDVPDDVGQVWVDKSLAEKVSALAAPAPAPAPAPVPETH